MGVAHRCAVAPVPEQFADERQVLARHDGLVGRGVPAGMAPDGVTLDVARGLLALPREVGINPASGWAITAGLGRFGPWLRHGRTYSGDP